MSVEEHKFPCDQCGADARFDVGHDQLICDHCGHTQAIDDDNPWQNPTREMDYEAAIAADLPEDDFEDVRVVDCPNCAAKIELLDGTHADQCPFCATPIVTDTGMHRHIKPKGLLPFALPEDEARAAMGKWLGKLWFAPNGLDEFARKGRKMQGVYVPFWTYDAKTRSSYSGMRGTIYYVTKTVNRNGKMVQVREARTRWRPASGKVSRFFDDVLILGSKSLDLQDADDIGPWDLSLLEPYMPEYLAGYKAEAYSIDLDQGFEQARAYMDRVILRDVKFDIGGDKQRVHHIHTHVGNVTFKHVLLPVWMAAYKFRGETYRVLINGTNGQVSGQRPWSIWKIALAAIGVAAIAGGIGYVIATNPELFNDIQ